MRRPKSMQRQFEIGHCLGKGGFGEVYQAVVFSSGGLTHEVAVKLLHPDLLHNEMARDRMRDEGRLLSRLNHPAIVTCYALTVLAGRIALVTEYVPGADLSVCCKMRNPIPLRALLQVIGKVSEALDLALNATAPSGQPMDLIHRDIKPGNIRIGQHGQPFLLDFGIARSDTIERNAHTAADLVVGSLLYMAPERFGPKGASSASDVFGLGCCLFEGVFGKPFYGASSLRDISRLANDAGHYRRFMQQRLVELPETTPRPLISLLEECLAHDPLDRPTAAALGIECERLSDELGGLHLRNWAREQAWEENPGEPSVLTGKTLDELPLPAPGQTLQALMPDLNISAGPAHTAAYVDVVEGNSNTWSDEDGVVVTLSEDENPVVGAPRAGFPRIVAKATTALALFTVLLGSVAFLFALWDRWEERTEPLPPIVMAPTLPVIDPPEPKDEPSVPSPKPVPSAPKVKVPEKKPAPDKPKLALLPKESEEVVPVVPKHRLMPISVKRAGDAPVELRAKGKVFPLPASVPHGTYQIWSDIGDGLKRNSIIVLSPGDAAVVTCSTTKSACSYVIE